MSILHVECDQRIVLGTHGIECVLDLADVCTISELGINEISLVVSDSDELGDMGTRL